MKRNSGYISSYNRSIVTTTGTVGVYDLHDQNIFARQGLWPLGWPQAVVTPSTTSVNEGVFLTLTVTTQNVFSGTTLYWTINGAQAADFSSTSGSFVITNGSGSISIFILADGTADGTDTFNVQVRKDSTSGTIIGTSATITINDTSTTPSAGYNLTSGTKAPVFGAGGASPYPPTGWTNSFNSNADDSNLAIPLSVTFTLANTAYTTAYVGSNSYITFGGGSNNYYNLSASNPALPKIVFGYADNSYQRVSYVQSGTDYTRIRFEGNCSTSGTGGSPGVVYEVTFFNTNKTSGNNVVEVLVGNRCNNNFMGIGNSSSYYTTGTFNPNTSYVFSGDPTGVTWTLYTGYYMSGTGY